MRCYIAQYFINLFCAICFCFVCGNSVIGQDSNEIAEHSVYLLGNFSDVDEVDRFLVRFNQIIDSHSNPVTVLLLGDAIDCDSDGHVMEDKLSNLKSFIEGMSASDRVQLIMVPGDKEWANARANGFEQVLELEQKLKDFVEEKDISNFIWPAKDGCPGPYSLELAEHLQLIIINSQWWVHEYDKPLLSDAICKYISPRDLQAELNAAVEDQIDKNVLVAGHHPFKSLSNFGGRYSLWQNLAPFPIYATFKNSYHSNIGSVSDLSHQNFDFFRYVMRNFLYTHHSLVYATGHDRNQQVMQLGENYLINSGAVGKSETVQSDYTTKLSSNEIGFIELKYSTNGSVNSVHHSIEDQGYNETEYSLFETPCRLQDEGSSNVNMLYVPCLLNHELNHDHHAHLNDKSITSASDKYGLGKFGRFWMGDRYRDDWESEIDVPFLDIDTSYQGLKAFKKGGGKQTVSLKFLSGDGNEYSFRSLDKLAKKSLDFQVQETILSELFQRQVSAQHPYGALTIPYLLDKIDILHSKPLLYRIPDTETLGPFQHEYGGLLGMLELNPKKNKKTKINFANANEILQTNKMLRKQFRNPKHQVDNKEYLRARLFDILVGDWDRHEDNWKWAAFKKNKVVTYRPIPKDRDNVYSKWDGVLPTIADEDFGLFYLEGFDKKIRGFRSLVFQARNLDRLLLNSLELEDYIAEAESIQNKITEEDIRIAIEHLPPASFSVSGEDIIEKLVTRKADLKEYATKFYNLLSKEIVISASSSDDMITISELDNKFLYITVTTNKKSSSEPILIYERKINPSHTKSIRLYGLTGDDSFNLTELGETDVEIVLVGGNGKNDYSIAQHSSNVKILDREFDPNDSELKAINKNYWNDKLYDFDHNEVKFNTYLPFALLGYNRFLGATLSGQVAWTRRRWDKARFSSTHLVGAKFSSMGDLGFIYNGRWGEVFNSKWDSYLNLELANPNLINAFYGLGSGTQIDRQLEEQDFYLARHNRYVFHLGLIRSFWKKSEFSLGAGFGIYNSSPFDNSILSSSTTIEGARGTLSMIPIHVDFNLDLRDNASYPTSGVQLRLFSHNYLKVRANSDLLGILGSSINYHVSTRTKRKMILSLKAAANKGFGSIPYYLQNSLGSNSGLRGFTGFRFTGESMVYFNSEIKMEIYKNLEASIPITAGLLGFYDRGKVFTSSESNVDYRYGYGAGVYLIPFSRRFIFSVAFSWSEEQSFFPNFNLGSVF